MNMNVMNDRWCTRIKFMDQPQKDKWINLNYEKLVNIIAAKGSLQGLNTKQHAHFERLHQCYQTFKTKLEMLHQK